MDKQAPPTRGVIAMAAFTLSCMGILLFLWQSFGGSVPLKPKAYRIDVAFPEAVRLSREAPVRIAGIDVGRVKRTELARESNRTLVTVEIEKRYAPLRSNSRAVLRQKSLLGEVYVEVAPGTASAPFVPDGGRLVDSRVDEAVQFDEILSVFDPTTRTAFRSWQRDARTAIEDRGDELNQSFGNLPRFVSEGADLFSLLERNELALSRLILHAGGVFEALTRSEDRLRTLMVAGADTFEAAQQERVALAQTLRIMPTFLRESRATFARLAPFARRAEPVVRDLQPVLRDVAPTVRSARAAAPDLRRLLADVDPLVDASSEGLPAASDVLRGAPPLLGRLGSFLEQLNPVFEWLALNQYQVSDFFTHGTAALSDTTPAVNPAGALHYLRAILVEGPEAVGIYPERTATNRGNAYLLGTFELDRTVDAGIFPNFDCKPSGGEVRKAVGRPACFVQTPFVFQGRRQGAFPHVKANRYRARR